MSKTMATSLILVEYQRNGRRVHSRNARLIPIPRPRQHQNWSRVVTIHRAGRDAEPIRASKHLIASVCLRAVILEAKRINAKLSNYPCFLRKRRENEVPSRIYGIQVLPNLSVRSRLSVAPSPAPAGIHSRPSRTFSDGSRISARQSVSYTACSSGIAPSTAAET